MLSEIQEEDLLQDLEIKVRLHRVKILEIINKLKRKNIIVAVEPPKETGYIYQNYAF